MTLRDGEIHRGAPPRHRNEGERSVKPYYEHGGITIYHGDALELVGKMPLCDLVLTDPPFFMPAQHYASRSNWQRSWGDTSILGRWFAQVLDAILPRMNPAARVLCFCDDESYPVFYPELYGNYILGSRHEIDRIY